MFRPVSGADERMEQLNSETENRPKNWRPYGGAAGLIASGTQTGGPGGAGAHGGAPGSSSTGG